eukprot:4178115-Pyramimonas_sp.AAC.3
MHTRALNISFVYLEVVAVGDVARQPQHLRGAALRVPWRRQGTLAVLPEGGVQLSVAAPAQARLPGVCEHHDGALSVTSPVGGEDQRRQQLGAAAGRARHQIRLPEGANSGSE